MTANPPEPDPIRVSSRMRGGTRVVSVTGEIDLATADEVSAALARREPGEDGLVLDLTTTSFLDSSGIRVLVEAHRAGERDGVPFGVVPGSESIRSLLETTGVAQHLALHDAPPG